MAGKLRAVTQGQIRTLFDAGTTAGLTDGQLLERFATRRDERAELAFAVLVERHGPMVLRTCRVILRDDHEAMDAFQATFLILARKGSALWVRDSVGPWLHRVACNTARRARRQAMRRRMIEQRAAAMAKNRDGDDHEELASVIHEEVDKLPERYREPIVLCELEGRTCEEAARHLGCPVGTIGSRLARGRQRLRDRLRRRGLAPGAGVAIGPGIRDSISPALVNATSRAAVQFVSIRAAVQGSAASLALEVLRSMVTTRCWKAATLLFVLGPSTSGVVALAGRNAAVADPRADDPPAAARVADVVVSEVKPGKLNVVVEGRGRLESSENKDLFSTVAGQTTIITIVPEGSALKKGQVICELDSAALKDRLVDHRTALNEAEAARNEAKAARELAEIAATEYIDGIYPKERAAAAVEVARAQLTLTKTKERLKRLQAARQRLSVIGGGPPKTTTDLVAGLDVEDRIAAAELSLVSDTGALEVGQEKLNLLQRFTRAKTLKTLENEVEKARSLERARGSAVRAEQSKAEKLEREIASCTIVAPADGCVVYANDSNRFATGPRPSVRIEEGVTVRERQKIVTVTDLNGPKRVVAKVPESSIGQVVNGMSARIKVDAFANETFAGVVEEVAPLPNPFANNSGEKVYDTRIAVLDAIPGLRPGMTVQVELFGNTRGNVPVIPASAVVWYDGHAHVAVKTPDGKFDWRDVSLRTSDGDEVEVSAGLKTGEAVATDPKPLLSEDQRQKSAAASGSKSPGRSKAKGKSARISAALRAKLQSIPADDRVKLRNATPGAREAVLKKAGLTDDEIKQYNELREQAGTSR